MHDVFREVMIAVSNIDLLPGDPVTPVAHRFGFRLDVGQVGSGLRLGQVHRSRPLTRHQFLEVQGLLFVRRDRLEGLYRTGGQAGADGK
jgi:hypothetical protein